MLSADTAALTSIASRYVTDRAIRPISPEIRANSASAAPLISALIAGHMGAERKDQHARVYAVVRVMSDGLSIEQ